MRASLRNERIRVRQKLLFGRRILYASVRVVPELLKETQELACLGDFLIASHS